MEYSDDEDVAAAAAPVPEPMPPPFVDLTGDAEEDDPVPAPKKVNLGDAKELLGEFCKAEEKLVWLKKQLAEKVVAQHKTLMAVQADLLKKGLVIGVDADPFANMFQ